MQVAVVEHMASVGRKLLLAGRSGLNLTNSESVDEMLPRFGTAHDRLASALESFTPTDLRAWSAQLGESTFIGTTGRVFPRSLRATPLLRAWLRHLDQLGVRIETRTRFSGWATQLDGSPDPHRPMVTSPDGQTRVLDTDITVLALGGGSWQRVGSDGVWVETLRGVGIDVRPLRAANSGVRVAWPSPFIERFGGAPIKNVSVAVQDGHLGSVRGDLMITATGLEGGPVYTLSADVRSSIDHTGVATLLVDLHPDLDHDHIVRRLEQRRPKDSLSTALKRSLGLSPPAIALLQIVTAGQVPRESPALGALLKAAPVHVDQLAPIERAISSAGGIAFDEVDDAFMLRRLPSVFVAGEMLDWEAPTGGYLLQATFATGVAAARGALRHVTATDQGM